MFTLDYGKFHNDGLLLVLMNINENNNISIGDLLNNVGHGLMKIYPKVFEITDITKLKSIFDFSQKISDFKYDNAFYNKIKQIGKVDELDKRIVDYFDDAFQKNEIYEKDIRNLKKSLTKPSVRDEQTLNAIHSVYQASFQFWNLYAPIDYLPSEGENKVACDPAQQVILADGITGFLFFELDGIGVLAGMAASGIVRGAQTGNGGSSASCI